MDGLRVIQDSFGRKRIARKSVAVPKRVRPAAIARPYLREISLKRDKGFPEGQYPFTIPAVKNLQTIAFNPDVTFIIGENGAGKSTLLEALV